MCGLIGAVSRHRNMIPALLDGLERLEYRGYDSSGVAVLGDTGSLFVRRTVGGVAALKQNMAGNRVAATAGIAHTRWATHGAPSECNAHPQVSNGAVAVVHNGIIENHRVLRDALERQGYRFASNTDTEVIAHNIHAMMQTGMPLVAAVRATRDALEGSYAFAVVCTAEPERVVATRHSSPLLVGIGDEQFLIASDAPALLSTAQHLIRLEDDDIVDLDATGVRIFDRSHACVERPREALACASNVVEKQGYRHFMLKEIFEQGAALRATLAESERGLGAAADPAVSALLQRVEHVHLVACGTSYHAALVACYLIEALAGIPCIAERASEFRYRQPVTRRNSLFVALSQSGETADTLAALRLAGERGYLATLAICNQRASSLVRESEWALITQAGPEIGVASTKAFTTQVMTVTQLAIVLASRSRKGKCAGDEPALHAAELVRACVLVDLVLELEPAIKALARRFVDCQHVLFLGRGAMYPIAMEGALKLKEISYIHAEAHAAGELKHGPLALVDEQVPVIVLAPSGPLLAKTRANLEEVRARQGRVFVFTDGDADIEAGDGCTVITMPTTGTLSAPLVYAVPLQLLAYHVADLRGSNVDKPRNLAKSVTVE